MTYITRYNDPFEVLFRNFFNTESHFDRVSNSSFSHPVDIYDSKDGLVIEVAAIGVDEEDININVEDGNILRVSYKKQKSEEQSTDEKEDCFIHKGIKRSSFDLGWKIGTTYNLEEVSANLDKGLLTINIPFAEKLAPKQIPIISAAKKLIKDKNK